MAEAYSGKLFPLRLFTTDLLVVVAEHLISGASKLISSSVFRWMFGPFDYLLARAH